MDDIATQIAAKLATQNEELRARIAEVERERDEANASAVNAYAEACAARADAARLAAAIPVLRQCVFEGLSSSQQKPKLIPSERLVMALARARHFLAAHDAGTPAGGVWLTAEDLTLALDAAENIYAVFVSFLDTKACTDEATKEARQLRDLLRKARGGGA